MLLLRDMNPFKKIGCRKNKRKRGGVAGSAICITSIVSSTTTFVLNNVTVITSYFAIVSPFQFQINESLVAAHS